MKKRLILLSCLLLLTLSGCGKDPEDVVSDQTDINTEDSSQEDLSDIPEDSENSDEPVTEPVTDPAAEPVEPSVESETTEPPTDPEPTVEPTVEVSERYMFNESGLATDSPVKNLTVQPGNNHGELNFTWFSTSGEAGQLLIEKAPADTAHFATPSSYTSSVTPSVSVPNYYRNRVTVKGLEPGTDYIYQIGNSGNSSDIYSIHYADYNASEFSFAITSDQELGIGDDMLGIHEIAWSDTLTTFGQYMGNSAFMLSLGDQVGKADMPDQYDSFLDQTVLYSYPLVPVVGNHDEASSYWGDHFFVPNQTTNASAHGNDGDYWFRWGNVLFVVLNTCSLQDPDSHEDTMTAAYAANPDARWKVVLSHYSAVSNVERYQGMAAAWIDPFDDLERDFDIDLFLCGHDHLYSRGQLLTAYQAEDVPTDNTYTNPINPIHVIFSTATGCIYRDPYGLDDIDYSLQTEHPQISIANVSHNEFNIITYDADTMSVVDDFTIYKD